MHKIEDRANAEFLREGDWHQFYPKIGGNYGSIRWGYDGDKESIILLNFQIPYMSHLSAQASITFFFFFFLLLTGQGKEGRKKGRKEEGGNCQRS